MSALIVAHQGGWDETLMVLAPVAVVAGLLHLANRRAKRLLSGQEGSPAPAGPPDTAPPEPAPSEPGPSEPAPSEPDE